MVLWATLLLTTGGCSHFSAEPVKPSPKEETSPVSADSRGWRSVRFQINRNGDKTLWETDLLIAHRIISPVLSSHRSEIDLWRFHRRAGKDDTGHQFSFIFFTTEDVAKKIGRDVESNPLLAQLTRAGVLRKFIPIKTAPNDRKRIGDTSDPNWTTVMQDNWPYYIMGVSRMWLGMIDQLSREKETVEGISMDDSREHYKMVNDQITQIWQKEGYHALLHHLNAIYGYEAMMYWEKRWKSF